MNIERVKLGLENEAQFCREYKDCKNIQTTRGGALGKSASVQRRSKISSWCNALNLCRSDMLTTLKLEQYFNQKFELCPYGFDAEQAKPPQQIQPEPQPEETIMSTKNLNAPTVEVVTFIYGQPSKDVSDADIFNHIARLENEIKQLSAIQTKPKKLIEQLNKLQAEIDTLVAVVDGRE